MARSPIRNITGGQQSGLSKPQRRRNKVSRRRKTGRRPRQFKKKFPGMYRAELTTRRVNTTIKKTANQACSMLDPFCPHAFGARLFGDEGIRTVTLTAHSVFDLSTSTTQNSSFFFYPDWLYGVCSTVSVANVTTIPALTYMNYGGSTTVPADTYIAEGRVVSAGFIVRNISAATTVAGQYMVIPMTSIRVGSTFTGTPSLTDPASQVVQASKNAETAVVCYRKGWGSFDFHVEKTGTAEDQPDHQAWLVFFPPTSVVQSYSIEYYCHIEGSLNVNQQALQTIIGNGNGSNRPSDAARVVASKTTSVIPPVITDAVGSAASSFGKRLADQAVAAAVGMAVGYASENPQLGMLAYGGTMAIQDVD